MTISFSAFVILHIKVRLVISLDNVLRCSNVDDSLRYTYEPESR
jgi:hypothetical protein